MLVAIIDATKRTLDSLNKRIDSYLYYSASNTIESKHLYVINDKSSYVAKTITSGMSKDKSHITIGGDLYSTLVTQKDHFSNRYWLYDKINC